MFYKIVRCIKDILFVACVSYAMAKIHSAYLVGHTHFGEVAEIITLIAASITVHRDTKP